MALSSRVIAVSLTLVCGTFAFSAGPAGLGDGLADEALAQVRTECAQRCDAFFRRQSGKPLVKAPILENWNGRGDFTRHYNQSILLFSARVLYLDEQVDEANAALREMCTYHLDRPQTLLEIHSFQDVPRELVRLCRLYGPDGSRTKGLISLETYRVILQTLWAWTSVTSKVAEAEVQESQTWTTRSSENHHANWFSSCWAASSFLAGAPEYRDRTFEDGHSAAEHSEAWTAYLREYYRQRGSRGMTVEIDSPSYASATLAAACTVYDFATDSVLKRRVGHYITLYWALWAQQQLDGVSGGAKTRCYPDAATHGTDFIRRAAWYVIGTGDAEFVHASMLPFVTSSWRMPDVVRALALDPAGRGTYEVFERRPGLMRPGRQQEKSLCPLNPDFGGIVRYGWCTPDFIMGSLLLEARPNEDWAPISSQNRWHGVIFRGSADARVYPFCATKRSTYNQHWAVQRKGTLISQKLNDNQGTAGLRVWFSKDGLSVPVKDGDWYFTGADGGWAAVRVVSGESRLLEDSPPSARTMTDEDGDEDDPTTRGIILECEEDFSPVIIEVARKADFPSREDFQKAVLALPLTLHNGVLSHTGLGGDRFTLFTGQDRPPEINGQPVNYAPARVYDSPFVQSDWASGVVTIGTGGPKLTLDFNASEPPPHPVVGRRLVPLNVDWKHPVYETAFTDAGALVDWRLEGGKRMSVQNGRLVLESEPPGPTLTATSNHLVCWLTKEMPADFVLEFKVCPRDRSEGLNIVFFNARGLHGERIFDPVLAPRSGIFAQYHSGDLDNYHISYWAGGRGTANLRKNKGFALVATGSDLVAHGPAGTFQTVRLYKRGGTIRLMVDDVVSVAYDDDGKTHGPVWSHPGWIGLRQMAHTVRCEYDDLKIYPCNK